MGLCAGWAERERDRSRVIVVNGDGVRQAGLLGDHDERDGGEGDTVDTEHREDVAGWCWGCWQVVVGVWVCDMR